MPNTQNKLPPSLFGIFLDMMLANRQIGYQNKREIVFERRRRRKFRENISLSLHRYLVNSDGEHVRDLVVPTWHHWAFFSAL